MMGGAMPDMSPPSPEYLAARGAGTGYRSPSSSQAMPKVNWAGNYVFCCYGTVTPVCISAWVMFIGIPLLFYLFVRRRTLFAAHTQPARVARTALRAVKSRCGRALLDLLPPRAGAPNRGGAWHLDDRRVPLPLCWLGALLRLCRLLEPGRASQAGVRQG
eukprot:1701733-Prymnesium_polylepis.2